MNRRTINADARGTERDDTYPTCERTCAKLHIYPKRLSHEEVTRLLAIEPTKAVNAGDCVYSSRGVKRVLPRTLWLLSSEAKVFSKDVRAHLDWLLDQVEEKAGELADISRDPGTKIYVTCIWWSAGGHGGPTLWPEQMQRLATLGLELRFDFQFYGDEDE